MKPPHAALHRSPSAEPDARPGRVPRAQSGAAAVETAFVFPVLLMLAYCTVVYGYVFMAYQTIAYAAQSGAEAAVQVPFDAPDYESRVTAVMYARVAEVTAFLANPRSIVPTTSAAQASCPTASCRSLTVSYPLTGIFPVIGLPPLIPGPIPPLPAMLTASATVTLAPP